MTGVIKYQSQPSKLLAGVLLARSFEFRSESALELERVVADFNLAPLHRRLLPLALLSTPPGQRIASKQPPSSNLRPGWRPICSHAFISPSTSYSSRIRSCIYFATRLQAAKLRQLERCDRTRIVHPAIHLTLL